MISTQRPWDVMVAIPTIDSSAYIAVSMAHLREEIMRCPPSFRIHWVLCVNGAQQDATHAAIDAFAQEHPALDICVLRRELPGRNGALNALLAHAREQGSDIIHFFDDDVTLAPGTLLRNLCALVAHEEAHQAPLLVGAALRGRLRTLRSFREMGMSVFAAFRAWCWHRIFVSPYLEHVEVPMFCEGFCFGALTRYMRDYPDDASGITDDTFMSNTFALYRQRGVHSLPTTHKPEGSIGYMEVPWTYGEWRRQQIRIHSGIIRSFRYFSHERSFLARHFAWPFAFLPETQTPLVEHSLSERVFALLFRALHQVNYRKAKALVEADVVPEWGTAVSTKPSMTSG